MSNMNRQRTEAWRAAARAMRKLRQYAIDAENREQPEMSDDAMDACSLAREMREYIHRMPDEDTP